MSLPVWDPRRILELPPAYNLFQKAVGAERSRRHLIQQYVAPLKGGRVLEVGCGPGTNCKWFPEHIEYVGCDIDEEYIDYARQRYGCRAEFHVTPVGKLGELGLKPFDVVIALAVLHHLSDDEVHVLCDEAAALLKPGGCLVTGDPCFAAEQSRVERHMTSLDRGRFVRLPEQYAALVKERFLDVRSEVKRGRSLLIPNTGVILIAVKE